MYYEYFGLTQPPFRITPNTEFFFGGGNRGPILEALLYAINQGEGIIKVTGEVGSGKTMLCSMLQARLPPNIETVYLANPSVSPEEILHAIAQELHLKPPREAGHLEVMQMLNAHLVERHAAGKQVVMFVEESQSMPISTLEEIRLLSNLETANSKLLQIVLFGQPELEENLRQPQIRQLRERITHSFSLSPLKSGEIREYLNFRLRAAGYRGPDLFSPAIVATISKASGGLTRRINLIADKALLAAFSENTHSLRVKHIKDAVRDSEFSRYDRPPAQLRLGVGILLFIVGAGLGMAIYGLIREQFLEPALRETQPPVAVVAPKPQSSPPAVNPAEPAPATEPAPPENAQTPAAETAPTPPQPAPEPAKTSSIAPTLEKVNTNSSQANRPVDEIDDRLAVTKVWLADSGKNAYTIQLLGADSRPQLKQHLNVIRKYVEINDVFVYRTIAKQKPSLTVLYGSFEDRKAAQEALAKLPANLKAYKPVLRTMQGIRTEIAQHQSS